MRIVILVILVAAVGRRSFLPHRGAPPRLPTVDVGAAHTPLAEFRKTALGTAGAERNFMQRCDIALPSAARRAPLPLSFAGGLPAPSSFPRQALADAAVEAILSMGSGPLQYDWPEGRHSLRELVAAELRSRGAEVEAEEIVITNGAQDAIGIVVDVLAPNTVQVDPETYAGALDVFRSRGCAVSTVSSTLRYAMPALGNPSGRAATRAERDAMLNARWVLEDDAYAHLDFRGPAGKPLLAESRRHVFHVGTYSKVLAGTARRLACSAARVARSSPRHEAPARSSRAGSRRPSSSASSSAPTSPRDS